MLALDYDSLLLCDLVFPAADVRRSCSSLQEVSPPAINLD